MTATSREKSNLGSYGAYIARYQGRGILRNSVHSAACKFETGQLTNGSVLLLCDFERPGDGFRFSLAEIPTEFNGATDGDLPVVLRGNMRPVNWLGEKPKEPPYDLGAFYANELSVAYTNDLEPPSSMAYGVTNFPGSWQLQCGVASGSGDPKIVPMKDHRARFRRLQVAHDVDVTAELVQPVPLNMEASDPDDMADDVCHVLSVAAGSLVQWVYKKRIGHDGKVMRFEHFYRVTKPHTGLSIIDYRPPGDLQGFVLTALPTYRQRKVPWRLDQGTLAAYLDAKAEGDYLEIRGAKLAVAIEILKDAFRHCKDQCSDANTPLKYRNESRGSLLRILQRLSSYLGLSVPVSELKRFVKLRNSLIHTGMSCCSEDREPVEEWLFMVHLLDRLFLKLLGYSGPYINWSERGKPDREMLS